MTSLPIVLGAERTAGVFTPVSVNVAQCPHWLICGSSGSGKTVALLFYLWQIKKIAPFLEIFVADFKGSGDLSNLTSHYAQFEDCINLVEEFYALFNDAKKGKKRIGLLLFDEFAAFSVWLADNDKTRYKRVQAMIAEILMQGRELSGGGAWLWICVQRPDMEYFGKGTRENFFVRANFGVLGAPTGVRTMLFSGEEIPENYSGKPGTALVSVDGRSLCSIILPEMDKQTLKTMFTV